MGVPAIISMRATIGQNLAALRQAHELSIGELALRAGIGKATLSEIESGKRNATIGTLFALTNALGVPLGAPLQDVPSPVLSGESIRAQLAARLEDPEGTTELYRIAMRAGAPPHQAASAPALHKTAIVFSGALLVTRAQAEHEVSAGHTAQWSAESPETYRAIGDHDLAAALLLRYRRS